MTTLQLYAHAGAFRLAWVGNDEKKVIEILPDGRMFFVNLVRAGAATREEFTFFTDLYGFLKAVHEADESENSG